MFRPAGWRGLTRFELACLALVAVGLALRSYAFLRRSAGYDALWHMTMASSLLEHGEFIAEWVGPAAYTQHYPPAYPGILAGAFALFGQTHAVAAAVTLLSAVLLVGAALFCTWDLYGRSRGLAVAAITATFPPLVAFDAEILSESLVCAFFALTIWGILRSLDDPPYILLAGVFAGLGYLTKASMGPFFLLAGAGGFAWRFYYARWAVFRDRHYMAAAGLFALFVLPWAYRNVLRHGWPHWETQRHASDAMAHLFQNEPWWSILTMEALWSGTLLLAFMLPFLPEIGRTLRRVREERTSALWMAVLTPTLVAVFFVSAFYALEDYPRVTSPTNVRYLVTPIVPILWLGLRDARFDDPRPASAPTAGAPRIARERWLKVAGIAVVAFFVAASPAAFYVSRPRLTLTILGLALGLGLLLAARASAWAPVERVGARGVREWRAGPVERPFAGAWLGLAGFGGGVLVMLLVARELIPYFAAGAVALLLRDARWRVAGTAVVFLAAGLVDYEPRAPGVEIAAELERLDPDGATVATSHDREHYLAAYLDPGWTLVWPHADPDYVVHFDVGSRPPQPPDGYEVVASFPMEFVIGAGTRVGDAVWAPVFGDQQPLPEGLQSAYIYRKATLSPP